MKYIKFSFTMLLLSALALAVSAEEHYVVEDGGVGITRAELEQLVAGWTPQMRRVAADDIGDRMELLNNAMVGKKLSAEIDKLDPETDPKAYWRYQNQLSNLQQQFVVNQFLKSVKIPDMTALSKERYETEKDKYALVPEHRISSHILFKCPPGACHRPEKLAEAEPVLEALNNGADWKEMVQEYSEDIGTKRKDGKFDKWVSMATTGVSPPFLEGVFSIGEVGGYSGLVQTEFGVHIIRLDGIRPEKYKTYEEVKDKIIADLAGEYRQLALKDYQKSFSISDDGYIDGDAMEEIFGPYKSKEATAPAEATGDTGEAQAEEEPEAETTEAGE